MLFEKSEDRATRPHYSHFFYLEVGLGYAKWLLSYRRVLSRMS